MRVLPLVLVLAAACTSSSAHGPVAAPALTTLSVTVNATTCTPDATRLPAGPLSVVVSSSGAVAGSEVELVDGSRILGEEEAVRDGHSGGFSIVTTPGTLQLICLAGGKPLSIDLDVVAATPRRISAAAARRQEQLAEAAAAWHTWVQQQLDQLVVATKAFDNAVRAGSLERAAALYPAPRVFYERVEPVAESFGDLDPAIDARIDDVTDPALWTGFHRLEKAVFKDRSLAGMGPYATQLDVQVVQLANLAKAVETTGADLANGASSLLEEVARTKITGEEERYSRIDLVDLSANVEGAEKAFSLLRPALAGVDAGLDATLAARFGTLDAALLALKVNGTFPLFTQVDEAKRLALSRAVDGVSEPLSRVAALIVV